jgi:hypothetical protein
VLSPVRLVVDDESALKSEFLPGIHRVPEPLSAVAHGDPVARELCSGLFSTQGCELPEMLVP